MPKLKKILWKILWNKKKALTLHRNSEEQKIRIVILLQ